MSGDAAGRRRAEPSGWQAEIRRKHENHISMHVAQFGPLGQPMTPKQRKRLRDSIKRVES